MIYLISLIVGGIVLSALSILFLIVVVERCLLIADKLRELVKLAAMDALQIRTSSRMSSIDIDRARGKLELTQDYGQARLDEYKAFARTKLLERRLQLKAKQ
ncbi:MAG: hypothetical protein ACE5FZ_06665 [Nitrospiria bacterium]